MLTILVLLAFAPGIFWLWYFYKKDRLEPEPKRLIVKGFFIGMLAVIPAFFLELPFGRGLFLVVIAAPIVEETVKFFAAKKFLYTEEEFDEPMDGIIYAAAVALGFASLENVGYLLRAFEYGTLMSSFVLRAVLSVPGHVLFSAMWGYTMGLAKYSQHYRRKKGMYRGLVLAIFMHGLFNLFAQISATYAIIMLVFIFFLWRMVNRKIAIAHKISQHINNSSLSE